MDSKTKSISEEFVTDKQSPTRHSLEDTEAQSEISVDYAGASKKTDPAEIALVRKLDTCMMVSSQSAAGFPGCDVACQLCRMLRL